MAGQPKSVYLKDEDVERIEEHARRNVRSFSWALRDLVRLGAGVTELRKGLAELKEVETEWAIH